MKITRIGPSFPLLTAASLGGSGGSITGGVGSGLAPVSNGSNGWAWSSNVQTIQAGGSNVLGPIVNFAAGSNILLTIDQVGAVGSNTIRIHSSGAASFGSNSNQVSYANAPGASTDSSRADHVHMGVTSLAHSSNTFAGLVILTASGSLGITSPTPGTYNLSASGGSGGGSGGLPWRQEFGAFVASSNTNWTTLISAGTGGSVLPYLQSSGAQNDALVFEGVSLTAGTYTAIARVFKSTNHGIISIQLDSVEIGTIDLYAGAGAPDILMTATGMTVAVDDVYQLKLKMAAKNGSSSGYYGLVYSLALVRTA